MSLDLVSCGTTEPAVNFGAGDEPHALVGTASEPRASPCTASRPCAFSCTAVKPCASFFTGGTSLCAAADLLASKFPSSVNHFLGRSWFVCPRHIWPSTNTDYIALPICFSSFPGAQKCCFCVRKSFAGTSCSGTKMRSFALLSNCGFCLSLGLIFATRCGFIKSNNVLIFLPKKVFARRFFGVAVRRASISCQKFPKASSEVFPFFMPFVIAFLTVST